MLSAFLGKLQGAWSEQNGEIEPSILPMQT